MRGALILNTFCDQDCIFCLGRPQRVNYDQLIEIEKTIDKNIEFYLKENNIDSIELSGADPGEYHHLIQLISYLKKKGFIDILLSTNGVRIAKDDMLLDLYNAGLNTIKIPIYGANQEEHEKVCRKIGGYNYSIKSIKEFLGDVIVNVGVVQQNKDRLIEICKSVLEIKKNIKIWIHPIFVADDNYSYYVSDDELLQILPNVHYWSEKENIEITFSEFPMCVFGKIIKNNLIGGPPRQGIQQPKDSLKSEKEDIPSYRIKDKLEICRNCLANNMCNGFNRNGHNKFGIKNIKPILEQK